MGKKCQEFSMYVGIFAIRLDDGRVCCWGRGVHRVGTIG